MINATYSEMYTKRERTQVFIFTGVFSFLVVLLYLLKIMPNCFTKKNKVYIDNSKKSLKYSFYQEEFCYIPSLCPICLENYKKNDNLITIIYCQHTYHRNCLELWIKKQKSETNLHPKCPYCNTNINLIM